MLDWQTPFWIMIHSAKVNDAPRVFRQPLTVLERSSAPFRFRRRWCDTCKKSVINYEHFSKKHRKIVTQRVCMHAQNIVARPVSRNCSVIYDIGINTWEHDGASYAALWLPKRTWHI